MKLTLLTIALAVGANPAEPAEVQKILETTGVSGGLVVHVGCGDGTVTAALRANDQMARIWPTNRCPRRLSGTAWQPPTAGFIFVRWTAVCYVWQERTEPDLPSRMGFQPSGQD